MDKINVAIVGDGATDHKIFGKIIECILLEENPENISCEIISGSSIFNINLKIFLNYEE